MTNNTSDGVRKYRKKPVVIEAMLLERINADEVAEWCGGTVHTNLGELNSAGVLIGTLEGSMLANWGDYVIKGVQGEFYPCKPDIFKATYEEVL